MILVNWSSEQDAPDVLHDLSLATSFAVEFVKAVRILVINGPGPEGCAHVLSESLHSH